MHVYLSLITKETKYIPGLVAGVVCRQHCPKQEAGAQAAHTQRAQSPEGADQLQQPSGNSHD